MTESVDIGATAFDDLVISLIPSLHRSLEERFNLFRVMRHGTHEKQLSNVFAWLLDPHGTHQLGDAFQQLFVGQVNSKLVDGRALPSSGYRVLQEVDTAGPGAEHRDIADIVLTSNVATIVIENYESSDGHGHGFERYSAVGGTDGVVVLLCIRKQLHRLRDGWERAVVVSYADVLQPLRALTSQDSKWQQAHPDQHFFVSQLIDNYLEGVPPMDTGQQVSFIKAMCETGESERYLSRGHDAAAENFANSVALHARKQFEDSRGLLGEVKRALKQFAEHALLRQVNRELSGDRFVTIEVDSRGRYEWCITMQRGTSAPFVYLVFGPTAVVQNARVPVPLSEPDYSRVFVARKTPDSVDLDVLVQSDVSLNELLAGLPSDDTRLRDAVLAALAVD